MPARFAAIGDPHAAMDNGAGALDALLELAARDEASGLGDAPWPPHFAKAAGEPKRVQPSKAKPAKAFNDQLGEGFGAKRFRKRATAASSASSPVIEGETVGANDASAPEALPSKKPRAARIPKHPLVIVAQSPDKAAAEAGLVRWRDAHPEAAAHLAEDDILTDRMRGSAYIWYRIRVNLRHVPEAQRPTQQTPDPDDDPTRTWSMPNA